MVGEQVYRFSLGQAEGPPFQVRAIYVREGLPTPN